MYTSREILIVSAFLEFITLSSASDLFNNSKPKTEVRQRAALFACRDFSAIYFSKSSIFVKLVPKCVIKSVSSQIPSGHWLSGTLQCKRKNISKWKILLLRCMTSSAVEGRRHGLSFCTPVPNRVGGKKYFPSGVFSPKSCQMRWSIWRPEVCVGVGGGREAQV